jgi:uridine phosphorylase
MSDQYPILDFDPDPRGIIEPSERVKPIDIPEHCVLTFFQDVIDTLCEAGKLEQIDIERSEMGEHPIYRMEHGNQQVAVVHPGMGAPFSGGMLDQLIPRGCRKFIACGGCGVLDSSVPAGHVIIPTSALRDEGTSYHYLPPDEEALPSSEAVDAIKHTLDRHGVPHVEGMTWTTDAIFRETRGMVQKRREQGCIAVEMEAAAFFAVAQFRDVKFGQILYGGDDVSGSEWDSRGWQRMGSTREKLFMLAVESCLEMG